MGSIVAYAFACDTAAEADRPLVDIWHCFWCCEYFTHKYTICKCAHVLLSDQCCCPYSSQSMLCAWHHLLLPSTKKTLKFFFAPRSAVEAFFAYIAEGELIFRNELLKGNMLLVSEGFINNGCDPCDHCFRMEFLLFSFVRHYFHLKLRKLYEIFSAFTFVFGQFAS